MPCKQTRWEGGLLRQDFPEEVRIDLSIIVVVEG